VGRLVVRSRSDKRLLIVGEGGAGDRAAASLFESFRGFDMKKRLKISLALMTSTMLFAPVMTSAQEDTQPTAEIDTSSIGDEIVVRGRFIPEPQRATSQVASFLSKEDLARTGDDNAALALTRLSGLNVVSGKFAFVRGLGDRYSSALLNGSPLPSPEPLRRTVPLDLFPAGVLDGATVQKTFSPNYPGEFGGGVIDLRTLRDPGDSYLTLRAGVGANFETTTRDGIFVSGGDLDWLGYDDGTRSTPAPLQALLDSGTPLNTLTPTEIEAVGESLTNSPLSVLQEGSLGPNFEAGLEGGYSKDDVAGGATFGLIGTIGYKQDWITERAERTTTAGNQIGDVFDTTETTLDVTVNGLLSATLGWEDHSVTATALYIHTSSKQAQIDEGIDFNAPTSDGQVVDEFSGFYERDLIMGQLAGDHTFDDLTLGWRGAYARSTRDAPYERTLRRFPDPVTGQLLYNQANQYRINFSDLEDTILSGGVNASYTIPISSIREAVISAGYDYSDTDREFSLLALQFVGGNSLPLDVQAARPDFLFSPDNIDPARFVLQENSTINDNYTGALTTHAGFVMADVEILPLVRTTVGLRYETAEQNVSTFSRFGVVGNTSQLDNDYWLPSATVTWNFADDLQLRLGFSKTIARPQFRELAASTYFDPESERQYRGNRGLIDSKLTNYDLRLEYYLGRNQFTTLAGFYKKIEDPIEEIQFDTSTFQFDTTFINSPRARLFGGEAEYRTRFSMPFDGVFFQNRDWLFSVNYTYTNSEVQADPGDLIFSPFGAGGLIDASLFGLDGAQLQGAPEHIVNAQFGWEGDKDQFTLLFGWVDERILQRGFPSPGSELPDVVERPGIQLDAVFRQNLILFGAEATIGLAARNLLGTEHQEFQNSSVIGRTEFNTYERGRSISASLSATF
jgi:outer membrane receptor protein involved in Fe transport